jgi:hypothetical protein
VARRSGDPRQAANATYRGVLELEARFGEPHSNAAAGSVAMLSVSVAENDIADVRPCLWERAA